MKICILSRNHNLYSTKRLIEEAQKRGHDVNVIDYMDLNIMIEEGNPILMFKNKRLPLPDAIIPRIGASKTYYGCAVNVVPLEKYSLV